MILRVDSRIHRHWEFSHTGHIFEFLCSKYNNKNWTISTVYIFWFYELIFENKIKIQIFGYTCITVWYRFHINNVISKREVTLENFMAKVLELSFLFTCYLGGSTDLFHEHHTLTTFLIDWIFSFWVRCFIRIVMPPKSNVWWFFKRENNGNSVQCLLCETTSNYCGTTSNMLNHLKNKHLSKWGIK